MDNLTHSLAGIVTAELVVQARRARGDEVDPRWTRAAWLVSAAAHNAPDVDFVYAWITEGKLGYLLHHRGHTHTLAFAPLMALVPLLLAWAWQRRSGVRWSRADHAWLVLLAALGPLGHLWLDFTNNYGIHPFWPISSAWTAGDTVFIVEPLFLVATIPMAMLATRGRRARVAWGVALAGAVALPWLAIPFAYATWQVALGVSIVAAAALAATILAREPLRPLVALGASLLILAAHALSGTRAEASVREALARERPDEEVVDVARMPLPGAVVCWEAVVTSLARDGERYAVRVVRASAWPALVPVGACTVRPRDVTTAPLELAARALDPAVHLESELVLERGALRVIADRCDGGAFLRFARVPFVVSDGDRIVLGDLRYDRERALGFAEMEIPREPPAEAACPRFVPPWEPWRAGDLLSR